MVIAGKAYQTTMEPIATSTDSFETTINQTMRSPPFPVRETVNDWIRTVPSGVVATFDMASVLESSLDSGIWKANGMTYNAYIVECDGVHSSRISYTIEGHLV
jgi:hypothetical protein